MKVLRGKSSINVAFSIARFDYIAPVQCWKLLGKCGLTSENGYIMEIFTNNEGLMASSPENGAPIR